jgi:ubiquinone biosynthesis protein
MKQQSVQASSGTPKPSQRLPRTLVGAALSDVSRLGRITAVLARHGFQTLAFRAGLLPTPPRDEANSVDAQRDPHDLALRLRLVLEELGPTFVKVGQILSTRRDLLPDSFTRELARLQDQVPALSVSEVRLAVEDGLGGRLEDHFQDFRLEPLASASIAQTHCATLPGGEEVVVKVQRPGIEATIRADLDLLFLFAKVLEVAVADMELYAPGEIVAALDQGLNLELDFLHEAANLQRFSENFSEVPGIKIPRLVETHSSRTILTMERIRGRKVEEIEAGSQEGKEYAARFIEALYLMVFEHGVFHADPHPGNCFLTPEGELALIDFGLCGYLSSAQQDLLVSLIVSVIAGDIDGTTRALLRMGRPLGPIRMGRFKAEVAAIRDRWLRRSLKTIDVAAFTNESLDAAQRYRIRLAIEYALLERPAAQSKGSFGPSTPTSTSSPPVRSTRDVCSRGAIRPSASSRKRQPGSSASAHFYVRSPTSSVSCSSMPRAAAST